jgi:hypothetical protein
MFFLSGNFLLLVASLIMVVCRICQCLNSFIHKWTWGINYRIYVLAEQPFQFTVILFWQFLVSLALIFLAVMYWPGFSRLLDKPKPDVSWVCVGIWIIFMVLDIFATLILLPMQNTKMKVNLDNAG